MLLVDIDVPALQILLGEALQEGADARHTDPALLDGSAIVERRNIMDYTYGIFVYEQAASLDFIGPSDVFAISNHL
jgi:hypothetical protein